MLQEEIQRMRLETARNNTKNVSNKMGSCDEKSAKRILSFYMDKLMEKVVG